MCSALSLFVISCFLLVECVALSGFQSQITLGIIEGPLESHFPHLNCQWRNIHQCLHDKVTMLPAVLSPLEQLLLQWEGEEMGERLVSSKKVNLKVFFLERPV
jgi:hypothetical protein